MKKARIIKSYLGIIFCRMSKDASLGQKRDCIVQRLMGVFLLLLLAAAFVLWKLDDKLKKREGINEIKHLEAGNIQSGLIAFYRFPAPPPCTVTFPVR